MRNLLGPDTILGYCTNVHAGANVDQMLANLDRHALAVKQRVSPDAPMGVGLWFSAATARELIDQPRIAELRDYLNQHGLIPYTLNGFPHGDFHQDVVKHAVYQPDWSTEERLRYTIDLAYILHELLPEGEEGSISTLPLGWNDQVGEGWSDGLSAMIEALDQLESRTGRLIHLDLEPEPGCELCDVRDVLRLMMTLNIAGGIPKEVINRYLRICLDTSHAAVMFESATKMLEWCREGGFRIGKVQLASAVRVPFKGESAARKKEMHAALEQLAEPRYLHQTTVGNPKSRTPREFYVDLPDALAAHPRGNAEWRVHFHVPIHLERIGPLHTTRSSIEQLLSEIRVEDQIRHFEVETYAWNVLPAEHQVDELAEGIAQELNWLREQVR